MSSLRLGQLAFFCEICHAFFLPRFECTLNTIPGISDTTVAKLFSKIGNIRRFPNVDKLANFAEIAPVNFSSAGKGDDKTSKQGNKGLQGTIYFLAIQMIQLSSKGSDSMFRGGQEKD